MEHLNGVVIHEFLVNGVVIHEFLVKVFYANLVSCVDVFAWTTPNTLQLIGRFGFDV